MDVIVCSILSTTACLFMFHSILLHCVFVCNLTAMFLYVTSLQCNNNNNIADNVYGAVIMT